MSGDLAALQTLWGGLSGTTAEKLAQVNAATVAGPDADVGVGDVQDYLTQRNKLAGLRTYHANPPPGAPRQVQAAVAYLCLLIDQGAPITTSRPETMALVQQFLGAIVADPRTGLTADEANALRDLAKTQRPWWEANGFPAPVGVTDLINAGMLI